MTVYTVSVYGNAHNDEPIQTLRRDNATVALELAEYKAKSIGLDSRIEMGTAGDSELFEVFPKEGVGTVVVSKDC